MKPLLTKTYRVRPKCVRKYSEKIYYKLLFIKKYRLIFNALFSNYFYFDSVFILTVFLK